MKNLQMKQTLSSPAGRPYLTATGASLARRRDLAQAALALRALTFCPSGAPSWAANLIPSGGAK